MIDFSSWVTAISTTVLVAITFANLRVFKHTFDARFEPYVIVTLALDDNSGGQVIMLVIRNIGTGLAEDVNFELSRPIPLWAGGISPDSANVREEMTEGPLISGIMSLGPGESRKLLWGQYGGLLKAIGSEPVTVTCRFKRAGKSMPPISCRLEIESFKGIAAQENPLVSIAKNIKKLTDSTQKINSELQEIKKTLKNR